MKHPMQPIVTDPNGVKRFKENKIMPSAEEQALNDEVAMLLSILNFGYTAIRLPEITKDEKHDLLGFIPQYRYICNMPLMAEVNVHFDKSEE